MNLQPKFKETKIGMIPDDWEEVVFSEAIDVNPKRELKKGTIAKFVGMVDIEPFQRKITKFIIKEFKGGTKFHHKDTLFARITPCLENGKTAFVDFLKDDEVGFGSTEFIVLSSKKGKTDADFVYYLSRTPEVRKIAIKSMTGTSGRQRVENEIFNTIIINLPPLSEQTVIAKILSDLDEKIELNQQMNKTLEAIGQALFKQWFVNFEFPNEKELGDIILLEYGKGIHTTKRQNGKIPIYGSGGLMGFQKEFLVKGPGIIVGRAGCPGKIHLVKENFWPIDSTFYVKTNEDYFFYIYYLLKKMDLGFLNSGSAVPGLNRNTAYKQKINFSNEEKIKVFNDFCKKLFNKVWNNEIEIEILSQIRDSLLPKLISGKIRVPLEKKE
jgi:type I restriction enzyme S subunit